MSDFMKLCHDKFLTYISQIKTRRLQLKHKTYIIKT